MIQSFSKEGKVRLDGEVVFKTVRKSSLPYFEHVVADFKTSCRFAEIDGCPASLRFTSVVVGSLTTFAERQTQYERPEGKIVRLVSSTKHSGYDEVKPFASCPNCGYYGSLPQNIFDEVVRMAEEKQGV